MSLLLSDSRSISPVGIVGLVDVESGIVESSPKPKGKSKDEKLVGPTIFENLANNPPSALDNRLRVPSGDHLLLTTLMRANVPKTGLTVWE